MSRRGKWIVALAALGALPVAPAAADPATSPDHAAAQTMRPAGAAMPIGGPFELVDQDGNVVTERDFRGRLMLVYFGYTWCADVCPMDLQNLSGALEQLGPEAAGQVAFLFVTVDPQRDTPARLKEYVELFPVPPRGLTGSAEQVERAARAYRVIYRRHEAEDRPDGYVVDHSAFAYLMGRDGTYLTTIAHGASPQEVAAAIESRLRPRP